jgi:cytochrome oxidase Cu insertion factor (SCO1/SenC/PrrC family)
MTETPPNPPDGEEHRSHQTATTAVAIALLIIACAILFRYMTAGPNHVLETDPRAMMMNPAPGAAFTPIANGETAPDFTLPTLDGKEIALSTLHKGKHALVVFYVPCGSG